MNLKESIISAISSIRGNKLRASLTLLGIVIGVFSIIGVMTLLDALQKGLDGGLSQLGTNTFQVQKTPALSFGGPGARRKFEKRKDITLEQGLRLKEIATQYKYIGLEEWLGGKIVKSSKLQTNPNSQLGGVTTEFLPANNYILTEGRWFSEQDVLSERHICVLGMDIVDKIFPNTNPVGQEIEIDGNKFEVVGFLAAKGQSLG